MNSIITWNNNTKQKPKVNLDLSHEDFRHYGPLHVERVELDRTDWVIVKIKKEFTNNLLEWYQAYYVPSAGYWYSMDGCPIDDSEVDSWYDISQQIIYNLK